MAGELIHALKAAFDVKTDVELARVLGVERSAIAQWKRRGGVPEKYLGLLSPDLAGGPGRMAKFYNAIRHNVLGRAENQYFLRAGLAFMGERLPTPSGATRAQVGVAREFRLIRLMEIAQFYTHAELGKRYCETEAEYEKLIEIMEEQARPQIDRILSENIIPEVPQ